MLKSTLCVMSYASTNFHGVTCFYIYNICSLFIHSDWIPCLIGFGCIEYIDGYMVVEKIDCQALINL